MCKEIENELKILNQKAVAQTSTFANENSEDLSHLKTRERKFAQSLQDVVHGKTTMDPRGPLGQKFRRELSGDDLTVSKICSRTRLALTSGPSGHNVS